MSRNMSRGPASARAGRPPTLCPGVWLGLAQAFEQLMPWTRLLSAGRRDPGYSRHAAIWFVPIGFGIGALYAQLFGWTWRVYNDVVGIRAMPAAVVVAAGVAVLAWPLFAGLARTVGQMATQDRRKIYENQYDHSIILSAAMAVVVLLYFAALSVMPTSLDWHVNDWRRFVLWAYPRVEFRALIVLPMWGRFAMLLAASIGRASRRADPATQALCMQITWRTLLASACLPVGLTIAWFSHFDQPWGVVLVISVCAVSYLASVVLVRACRGHRDYTVAAVGLVAELTFLVVFMAFARGLA